MKLTVVAATGGIGRQILEQAVAAGHDVTVLVRNPAKVTAGVRVVRADLSSPDPGALASAAEGADAVLSGLGARSKADEGVAARGTRAIVSAMRAAGTRRIIVVSAAPIGTVPSPGRPNPPKHDPGVGRLVVASHGGAARDPAEYLVARADLRVPGAETDDHVDDRQAGRPRRADGLAQPRQIAGIGKPVDDGALDIHDEKSVFGRRYPFLSLRKSSP